MIQSTLREAAKRKYPDLYALAAALDMSHSQAWRFVNGRSGISAKRLDLLAQKLGATITIE